VQRLDQATELASRTWHSPLRFSSVTFLGLITGCWNSASVPLFWYLPTHEPHNVLVRFGFSSPVLALADWTNRTIRTSALRVHNSARKIATTVPGGRSNENQACHSNNCNSRRSGITGLRSAAISHLSRASCFGKPNWSPNRRQRQCEYEHSMNGGISTHYFRASCYY